MTNQNYKDRQVAIISHAVMRGINGDEPLAVKAEASQALDKLLLDIAMEVLGEDDPQRTIYNAALELTPAQRTENMYRNRLRRETRTRIKQLVKGE